MPLAVSPGTFDEFVLPKLAVAQLLLFTLLGLLLGRWALAGRSAIRRTPLDLPLLAWGASAVLSTLLATNHDVALFGTYFRYQGLLTILTCAALFWLAIQTLETRKDVKGLLRSLLAGAYIVAIISVIQSLAATAAISRAGAETAFTFGGWVRASGTFGNADYLGIFLAMVLPLAVQELLKASAGLGRLLWANVAAVMAVALLLTFSRGAWVGAAVGVSIVSIPGLRRPRPRDATVLGIVAALVLVSWGLMGLNNRSPIPAIVARSASLADPTAGTGGTRLHIWRDTLNLIAARPVAGWGPDTFGLVFPRFQTGDWTPGAQIDRAHSDLLDVASSQGLLGVAAYMWLLASIALAFWRGRRWQGSLAGAGAVAAYLISMLVSFAWVPATAPFSLILAAAVATWTDLAEGTSVAAEAGTGRRGWSALCLGFIPLVGAAILLVTIRPLVADALFLEGLQAEAAGQSREAQARVAGARGLAPEQATYAAEAGDLALDLQPDGLIGPKPRWAAARTAYLTAIQLGPVRPIVYEHLADADRALGRGAEAEWAARTGAGLAAKD